MLLQTERLLLRPIVDADAIQIYEYSKDPIVGPAAGWKPHSSIDETRVVMDTLFIDRPVFGIVLRQTGVLFGTIGLVADPKRENPAAMMLGYASGSLYWGNGYMTEAARRVVRYAFEQCQTELLSVYCYSFNRRSQRVIEKCGFDYEGCLRRASVLFDGTVCDEMCYSLTRERYEFQRH